MAKRFTDTNKYKKPFIRGLQGAYKVLWDYLYHDCDHAGIWIVDFEIAQIYVGHDLVINKSDALKYFNENEERIIEVDCGKKWFIPSFIEFQYGELSPENRAHKSVINILENKGLTRVLQGRKDMDKDKVMVKDKVKVKEQEKEKNNVPVFDDFLIYAKTLKIYHSSFDFQIEAKYNAWNESGWKDGNNKKISNWKIKLQNTMPYFKKDFTQEKEIDKNWEFEQS